MQKTILLFIFLLTSIFAYTQTKDRDYYLDVSKALGYVYGIELTNDFISEKYPTLANKIIMINTAGINLLRTI